MASINNASIACKKSLLDPLAPPITSPTFIISHVTKTSSAVILFYQHVSNRIYCTLLVCLYSTTGICKISSNVCCYSKRSVMHSCQKRSTLLGVTFFKQIWKESDNSLILWQRHFDASCIIFKLRIRSQSSNIQKGHSNKGILWGCHDVGKYLRMRI